MVKEFKEFALRGNMLDMAVGIIIGAAFGKIVASFVSDILMPPIGLLLGNVDFSNLFINLSTHSYTSLAAAKAAGAPTMNYGVFVQTLIDFLLVAIAIYLLVRQVNKLKRGQPEGIPAATTKECPACTTMIPLRANRCPHCTTELKVV